MKPFVSSKDTARLNKPNEGMIGAGGIEEAHLIEDVLRHKRLRGQIMYLVKWQGFPTEFNTWEPLHNIVRSAGGFIDNYLEDHGLSKEKWNPDLQRSKQGNLS